jgi:hypothetical protein
MRDPVVGRSLRGAAAALLLTSVAACVPGWLPAPTPTPTPTPTPMSTLDAFKARVTSAGFQAQGSITGSVKVALVIGSGNGSVTGTFKVKGGDSATSISVKVLGTTTTYESFVVGGWAYGRSNEGGWSKAPASGQTLQGFVGSGVPLVDGGPEVRFDRLLHRLSVSDPAGVDPAAFGITTGSSQDNLAITSLAFWAETDGTPAGLSIEASLDQKISIATAHEQVSLDIVIDSLSGVTIEVPTI